MRTGTTTGPAWTPRRPGWNGCRRRPGGRTADHGCPAGQRQPRAGCGARRPVSRSGRARSPAHRRRQRRTGGPGPRLPARALVAARLRCGMMAGMPGEYRLYQELADWWPLISPPGEYAAEAAYLAAAVRHRGHRGPRGARPGQRRRARRGAPEGPAGPDAGRPVGRDAGRVAAAQPRVRAPAGRHAHDPAGPDVRRRPGPRRRRLRDRRRGDLRQLIATAFAHCRPGGMAVFVPDYTAETFQARHGRRRQHRRGRPPGQLPRVDLGPGPADDWIQVEYEFTLRAADGTVQVVREAHRLGAFRRDTWLRLLAEAGFEPEARFAGGRAPRPGAAPVQAGCPRTCSSAGVRAEGRSSARRITATGAAAGATGSITATGAAAGPRPITAKAPRRRATPPPAVWPRRPRRCSPRRAAGGSSSSPAGPAGIPRRSSGRRWAGRGGSRRPPAGAAG